MDSQQVGLAVYQRVGEAIKEDIRAGVFTTGDKLPGHRRLAELYKTSLGTAQKAVAYLERQGWVITTPTVGTFVADPNAKPRDLTGDQLTATVTRLAEAFESLDRRLAALESAVYGQPPAQDDQDVEQDQ